MGKMKKCEYWYKKEDVEKDIRFAVACGQDEKRATAHSLVAISKSLYNIMTMMDKEDK